MFSLLYDPTLTSIHDYWKNHSFDHMDFVSKMISLLFHVVSSFVITFLPVSKHLLVSRLLSLSAVILESKKMKSVTASTFSQFIYHEMMGLSAVILVFFFSFIFKILFYF